VSDSIPAKKSVKKATPKDAPKEKVKSTTPKDSASPAGVATKKKESKLSKYTQPSDEAPAKAPKATKSKAKKDESKEDSKEDKPKDKDESSKPTKKEQSRIDRPSPTESAAENPGAVMIGKDGLEYTSTANKNGIYAWKKPAKTS
jgi:hypothetical protein